jgi:prevent-host-death family protein
MNWHLQDAKNNFSKLVREAIKNGPQTVTLRGERAAVVLSAEDYDRLKAKKPTNEKKLTFVEHLLNFPVLDDDIVDEINRRDKRPSREIEF